MQSHGAIVELQVEELVAVTGGDGKKFAYRVGQAVHQVVSFFGGVIDGIVTGEDCDR
jgi:hypothetical protein